MQFKRYCKTLSLANDPSLIEDYKKVHAKGQACVITSYSIHYTKLYEHLPYALELVEKFPEQPFVIDHIAKPEIKA